MAGEYGDGIDVIGATEEFRARVWTPDEARVLAWFEQSAYLDLGHVCNQACRYCWQGAQRREALPVSQIAHQVAILRREGIPRAILIGGEPLVHPEFFTVVKLLRESGICSWGLMSNGFRLAEPGLLERLLGEGLGYCQISFDSPRPEVQNALAGNPRLFDALQEVFGLLAQHPELPVDVNAVLTAENAGHLTELVEFFVELRRDKGFRPVLAVAQMKPVSPPADARLRLDDAAAAAALRPALVAAQQAQLPLFVRNLPESLLGEFARRSTDSLLRVLRVS